MSYLSVDGSSSRLVSWTGTESGRYFIREIVIQGLKNSKPTEVTTDQNVSCVQGQARKPGPKPGTRAVSFKSANQSHLMMGRKQRVRITYKY